MLHIEDVRLALTGQCIFDSFDAKSASSVIETRQDRTRRVNQSSTAARYMNAARHRNAEPAPAKAGVMSIAQT